MKKKEAIEILKDFHDKSALFSVRTALETLIPELEDSEDERIRKEIQSVIKQLNKDTTIFGKKYNYNRWIAWLEKQKENVNNTNKEYWKPSEEQLQTLHAQLNEGAVTCSEDKRVLTTLYEDLHRLEKQVEQKHNPYSGVSFEYNGNIWGMCARDNGVDILLDKRLFKHIEKQDEQNTSDKPIPKFKVGDWIISPGGCYLHILDIKKDGYLCKDIIGKEVKVLCEYSDSDYKLWTIQDARDGDVLANVGMVLIFKEFEMPAYKQHIIAYIGLDWVGHIQVTDNYWTLGIDKAKPATKEQRDLLFQKMKEAGYEWDAEKKELK